MSNYLDQRCEWCKDELIQCPDCWRDSVRGLVPAKPKEAAVEGEGNE
jgi:hypothetical protein